MADRSPFPGMDPWLESYWGDVQHMIISDLADQISASLPSGFFVSVEEMVYVLDPEWPRQHLSPDVAVYDLGGNSGFGNTPSGAGISIAEPIRITIPDEPITEGSIQIRRIKSGEPVVTAIEVLSPTNKSNAQGRAEYIRKREDYYRAKINLVELDLLRRGSHLIGAPLESVDAEWITPYKAAVRRGGALAGLEVDYYPLPLRKRLPRMRLPLSEGIEDIVVDLQQPIERAYKRGRYGVRIDYGETLQPPLSSDDQTWAAEMIAAARKSA